MKRFYFISYHSNGISLLIRKVCVKIKTIFVLRFILQAAKGSFVSKKHKWNFTASQNCKL